MIRRHGGAAGSEPDVVIGTIGRSLAATCASVRPLFPRRPRSSKATSVLCRARALASGVGVNGTDVLDLSDLLQAEFQQTMIYVTHDQIEAMSLADKIAVIDQGKLGPPEVPCQCRIVNAISWHMGGEERRQGPGKEKAEQEICQRGPAQRPKEVP